MAEPRSPACRHCAAQPAECHKCLSCGAIACPPCFSSLPELMCSHDPKSFVLQANVSHEAACEDISSAGKSLAKTLATAFQRYRSRPCLGTFVGEGEGEPVHSINAWGTLDAGISWLTYGDVWEAAYLFRLALRDVKRNSSITDLKSARARVAILSRMRVEWLFADIACLVGGFVPVILHDSAPLDVLREQLASCDAVICGRIETEQAKSAAYDGLKIVVIEEVMALEGKQDDDSFEYDHVIAADPKETVSIVLTSGTSGLSKGLRLSDVWFNNFIRNPWPYDPLVLLLGYMPMSHQTGRMMTYTMFFNGGRGALHCGNMDKLFREFELLRPTMMVSAPRLYDLLYSEYQRELRSNARANSSSDVKKRYGSTFGSRMQCICTGGASTSSSTLDFLRDVFSGVLVADGYGASECGGIAVNNTLIDGVIAKIIPADGYDISEQYGELLVKTKTMSDGYIDSSEVLVDNDGFYHTGDIVFFDEPTRSIRLVDRRSNVVKLAQGEFVALQSLESLYSTSPLVQQICVHGDSSYSAVGAIVVAKPGSSHADIVHDLQRLGSRSGRPAYEIPSLVLVVDEPFSAVNGMLTPSHKIKRRTIMDRYGQQLAAMARGECPDVPDVPPARNEFDKVLRDLQAILSSLLHLPSSTFSSTASFFEIGGDSLTAVLFARRVSERYGVELTSIQLLQDDLTLRTVVELIQSGSLPTTTSRDILNLSSEADIIWSNHLARFATDKVITAKANTTDDNLPTGTILITGASGFLGHEILGAVRQRFPDSRIYAFSRSSMFEPGEVEVLAADLSQNLFGLSPEQFGELSDNVDLVFHVAANTNSLHSYPRLKDVNAVGTARVIAFCMQGRRKRLAHVSTIGIFSSDAADEGADISQFRDLGAMNGYSQSKWVAECLVHRARNELGLDCTVFRPGMICGSYRTARINRGDWVYRWLAGCIKANCFPPIPSDARLDWVSVEYVAESIAALAVSNRAAQMGAIHLCNPDHPTELASLPQMMEFTSAAIADSYKLWLDRICSDSTNPIVPMRPLFEGGFPAVWREFKDAASIALIKQEVPEVLSLRRAVRAEDLLRWKTSILMA